MFACYRRENAVCTWTCLKNKPAVWRGSTTSEQMAVEPDPHFWPLTL